MTREDALLLISTLPDPPEEKTKLGWTPWEVDSAGVFRFCYVRDGQAESDEWRGLAIRITINAVTVDRAFRQAVHEDAAIHALCTLAQCRMRNAEEDMCRMVPIYVAERIVKAGAS